MTDASSKPIQSEELQCLLVSQIQELYERQLGHQLSEITCNVFDNTLVIVMEGIVTRSEQLLAESNRQELAKKVRAILDQITRPQIKQLIEEIMSVTVVDFLCDTRVETDRAGAMAVFEFQPKEGARNKLNLM
ncbi:MAG: DUF2294 domain-containing protein [Microcoleaceae cyanobacterium]